MRSPYQLPRLAALGLLALLAGCSSSLLETKRVDYKTQSEKLPPLDVPPDLTAITADDRYAVPDPKGRGMNYSDYNKDRAGGGGVAAPANLVLPGSNRAHLERSGSERWLAVKATPEETWNIVKQFWLESGYTLTTEDMQAGFMETDWHEEHAKIPQGAIRDALSWALGSVYSTGERTRYRTRIERDTEPGTVDVYVAERGAVEKVSGNETTLWQPSASDPGLESEMLARLLVKFGVDAPKAAEQVAESGGPELAHLLTAKDGTHRLAVDEGYDKAWRRVGLALDRIGFTVEDRDRSQGLYMVRYLDPNAAAKPDTRSFLQRLEFWHSDESKNIPDTYRIAVTDAGALSTQVEVRDKSGGAVSTDTSERILNLLYQQLR